MPCSHLRAAAARAIEEILEPHTAPARAAIEPESAARSSARAGHKADRPARLRRRSALRLPKARSAKFRRARVRRGAGQHIELHCRRAPRRPGRRGRVGRRQGRPAEPAQEPAGGMAKEASTITSKIRSLLVGASVVVIVLGTFKMAMTLLDRRHCRKCRSWRVRASRRLRRHRPRTTSARPAMPAPRCAFDDLADTDRPAIAQ